MHTIWLSASQDYTHIKEVDGVAEPQSLHTRRSLQYRDWVNRMGLEAPKSSDTLRQLKQGDRFVSL